MPTMNISLPDPMKAFVEEEVSTGSYGSVSEYIRGLVREAQERKANQKLERLLLEGMKSGMPVEVNPEFWSEMRKDVAARIAAHKKEHPQK
jgi:antitoxin ParD1/3/4